MSSKDLMYSDKIGFSTLCMHQKSGAIFRNYQKELAEGTRETKDYFEFGTAFHMMVLQREKFNQTYTVLGDYPTGKYADAVKSLVNTEDMYKEGDVDLTNDWLQRAISDADLKCTPEALNDKIWNNPKDQSYSNMFNELKSIKGKSILSNDDWQKLNKMYQSLLNSDYSAWIGMYPDLFEDASTIEIHTELEINWNYADAKLNSLPLNSTIDRIVVNHKSKKLFIYDLKTTSSHISKFLESADEYDYRIQGFMYINAAKIYFANLIEQGYTIEYSLIVCEKTTKLNECTDFKLHESSYNMAKEQFEFYAGNLLKAYESGCWKTFNGSSAQLFF